ncbi:PREDICTED: uncharacterized protein LOC105558443 [Vollenhovia emeryi]|uniref:uncharacterized protein LOC105558443 n=1 Tax=Vollenhovia emeryi TaxID=411798 RepID=UPI0005F3A6CF|nr:PREDICTED: uncharacterized protein LOC105558443 [Vollenhovia emeryi]
MPAESSIYWNSADSRRSTPGSFGSTGGRHYVDPWDLENYAYLRRQSVADVSHRAQRPSTQERSLRNARTRSEYWYALSSMREPECGGFPYTQEFYCRPVRSANNSYYQQTIYKDERIEYTAPFPVYAPVLEISRFPPQEGRGVLHVDKEKYIMEAIPSSLSHVGHLNTYGHLKIDYTNSWNSLNRRISK